MKTNRSLESIKEKQGAYILDKGRVFSGKKKGVPRNVDYVVISN